MRGHVDVPPSGPLFKTHFGAQKKLCTEFDGAAKNCDSTARDAADNNTLRIFTWLAL